METSMSSKALVAAIDRVERQDVTRLVMDRLQSLLEQGLLHPGSKLPPEKELTKVLGVSRPSLRQAYKALNVLGIIRAVPGDGTYINESVSKTLAMPLTFLLLMKKISLEEVFEFRLTLECELAYQAAQRRTEAESQAIRAQLEIMERNVQENPARQYLEAEYEFHSGIAQAAHNNLLLEIIVIVGGLLWETRKRLVGLVPDRQSDFEQHRKIYLTISGQDAQAAAKAMRDHLQSALDLLRREGSPAKAASNQEQGSAKVG